MAQEAWPLPCAGAGQRGGPGGTTLPGASWPRGLKLERRRPVAIGALLTGAPLDGGEKREERRRYGRERRDPTCHIYIYILGHLASLLESTEI